MNPQQSRPGTSPPPPEQLLSDRVMAGATPRTRWLQAMNHALTSVSRTTRDPRLFEKMARRAGVSLADHLWHTFARVGDFGPIRVTDLALRLGMDRSTVSRQVSELVDLGYVRRVRDRHDRRAVSLELTEAGEAALTVVWETWREAIAEVTRGWSAAERKVFLALLQRFDDAFVEFVRDGGP